MKVTREVVIDLWPVYASGEASEDTRKLVDEFLREDPGLERELLEDDSGERLRAVPVVLEPDHEVQSLRRAKQAMLRREWPLFFAMLFSGFAFGRIVSDTSWDVSPRPFAVTAAIAAAFWILFLVRFARRLSALRSR
jgi:hypothetical protein